MEYQHVGVGRYVGGFASGTVHIDVERLVRRITRWAHDPVGDGDVGFPRREGSGEVVDAVGRRGAVGRCHVDGKRHTGRYVNERRCGTEGEVVQQQCVVHIDVDLCCGKVCRIVDDLEARSLGRHPGAGEHHQ